MGRDRFWNDYYLFACSDAQKETESDLAFLRGQKTHAAQGFVGFCDTLQPFDREVFVHASLKRFHPRAALVRGEALSAAERELVEAGDAWRLEFDPAIPGRRTNPHRLATAFAEALAELGARSESAASVGAGGSTNVAMEVIAGEWSVKTFAESRKLPTYYHLIRSEDRSLRLNTSVEAWLGIASQTEWDLASAGDEELVRSSFRTACERFFTGMLPRLIDLKATG